MSQQPTPQKRDRRKNAAIVALVAVVVILLGVVFWLAVRTGLGAAAGQRLAQLPGVRLLFGELDLGWAGIHARGQRLLDEGAALEEEGKAAKALQVYQQAQEAMPRQVEPHLALARAHEALGEGPEALKHLEAAVELDPEHAVAQRELGRIQCIKGDVEDCTETLETAIELAPDDPKIHYWLGHAYRQGAEERFADAEQAYLRALHHDPNSAEANLALGSLYQGRPGMEAVAFERLDEALRLAIRSGDAEIEAQAHAELARYYYATDNYDLCVQEWQKALEEYPEDEDALRRLGLCYAMRQDEGDIEKAVAALEHALNLDFGQLDAYYLSLGQFYASRQEYARAFFAWDQFLRFSEDEELKAEVRAMLDSLQEAMQEGQAP